MFSGQKHEFPDRPSSLRCRLIASAQSILIACAVAFVVAPAALCADGSIDGLETKFFEHSYPKDPTADRLTRLEKLVFGEGKSGSDAQRLQNLVAATQESGAESTPAPSSTRSSTASAPAAPPSTGSSNNYGSSTQTSSSPAEQGGKKKARTDLANYPRVDRLETNLLGKTYDGESVDDRLTRLEQKAFGAQTTIQDLSERTDRLEDYVASKNPNFNPNPPGPSWGNPNSGNFQIPPTEMGYRPAPTFGVPLDQQVAAMEQKVFGHPDTKLPLLRRVEALEKFVYKGQGPHSNDSLADRVTKLAGALQMSPTTAQVPSGAQSSGLTPFSNSGQPQYSANSGYGQQYSSGGYGTQPSYGANSGYGQQYSSGQSTQYGSAYGQQAINNDNGQSSTNTNVAQQDQTDQQQQQQKQKHGSILGSLAKALVGVGSMAGRSMGGMGMGMGGMGMGMPYGYGGMGGMGGYSPYGMGGMGGYSPYGMGGMGGYSPYGMGGMGGYGNPMGMGRIWP